MHRSSVGPRARASFDLSCHDIVLDGAPACEWCAEHEVVALAGARKPLDWWAVSLFVLHRAAARYRHRRRALANAAPAPAATR